jgi:hypothetical protein
MDKDRPRNVMRAPYRDLGKGEKIRHIVSYSELTKAARDKLEAADLTEHKLLELIIIEARKINLHLMSITDDNITGDDITWP